MYLNQLTSAAMPTMGIVTALRSVSGQATPTSRRSYLRGSSRTSRRSVVSCAATSGANKRTTQRPRKNGAFVMMASQRRNGMSRGDENNIRETRRFFISFFDENEKKMHHGF